VYFNAVRSFDRKSEINHQFISLVQFSLVHLTKLCMQINYRADSISSQPSVGFPLICFFSL